MDLIQRHVGILFSSLSKKSYRNLLFLLREETSVVEIEYILYFELKRGACLCTFPSFVILTNPFGYPK